MEKKPTPFASKAQAAHVFKEFKKGNISYPDMMKAVHATDFTKIPERIKDKQVDKKTAVKIAGLV